MKLLLLVTTLAGCLTTPHFPDVAGLERLERGVSTREDVLHVLGRPNGHGAYAGFLTRAGATERQGVWYYHLYASRGAEIDEGRDVARTLIEQHLLLVLFTGEHFDGYWWYETNDVTEMDNLGTAR